MSEQDSSLEQLRSQAAQCEAENLRAARAMWIQIWQKLPGDAEALAAVERIAVSLHDQGSSHKLAQSQKECEYLKQRLKEQEVLERSQTVLVEQLLSIGNALSGTCNLQELLYLILAESREITCSDAGSIYLVNRDDEIPIVCFEVSQNDSQPERSLKSFAVPMTKQSLVGYVSLTGETLNLPDAHNLPPNSPYTHHQTFDLDIDYCTRSVLVTPIHNPDGTIIGVIQLINRKISPDLIVTHENVAEVTQPYSLGDERVLQSLASQAAIAIERNQLLSQVGK